MLNTKTSELHTKGLEPSSLTCFYDSSVPLICVTFIYCTTNKYCIGCKLLPAPHCPAMIVWKKICWNSFVSVEQLGHKFNQNDAFKTPPTCAPAGMCLHRPQCACELCIEIITAPLWCVSKKKNPQISTVVLVASYKTCEDRWKMDYFVFLALLILAACGGDPCLGEEELAAGTDTHLEKALSISRYPFFTQR